MVVHADGQIRENVTERLDTRYHEVEITVLPHRLGILPCLARDVHQREFCTTQD